MPSERWDLATANGPSSSAARPPAWTRQQRKAPTSSPPSANKREALRGQPALAQTRARLLVAGESERFVEQRLPGGDVEWTFLADAHLAGARHRQTGGGGGEGGVEREGHRGLQDKECA